MFRSKKNLFFITTLILFALICLNQMCTPKEEQKDQLISQSSLNVPAGFLGSESCRSCHEKEYEKWTGSHHHLAMQKANDSTVLANWNTSYKSNGVTHKFFKDSSNFYVNTQDQNGDYKDFKVIYTFGVTPLQQYIVEFPDGAYQCLQAAWDTQKEKWFDLQPDLEIEPGEWIHWTGNAMRWNTACADCHSTDLKKNLNVTTGAYKTSYSEISVGCEGCHGPGSLHVDYHEKKSDVQPSKLQMVAGMNPQTLVDQCARCHSRRSQITKFYDYKGHYLDHYEPQVITYPVYERDGQILDEDYVYASFLQSKMYAQGISCRDCHDMHSMELKMTGNNLCMSCHEPKYNTVEHYFHIPGSDAAQCINCHMTGRTYMGNDFRRDHSFRIPRPDQTMKYGTPNACNGCHEDKSPEWAYKSIVEQFGEERADHFSDHLLAGMNGDKAELELLITNKNYPEIARAAGIFYYSDMVTQADFQKLKTFLRDEKPLVRNEAVKAIGNLNVTSLGSELKKRLTDTVRSVRINAAKYLSRWEPESGAEGFWNAMKEYQEYLDMNSDFPSVQHEIGQTYEMKGEVEKATMAYEKALSIDDRYNFSRMNLALLKYQSGNVKEAEEMYLTVINQEPDASYPYYMVGLLYNEMGDKEKSKKFMAMAIEKEPPVLSAFYNYALMLQQEEQYKKSLEVIGKGLKISLYDERLNYIKLLAQIKIGNKKEAVSTANLLIQINPQNGSYQQILGDLQGQ